MVTIKQPYEALNPKNDEDDVMDVQKGLVFKPLCKYAFTINPDDLHQYADDPTRFNKFLKYWNKKLNSLSFVYKMYIEVSNPDCNVISRFPRFHMHGCIFFKTWGQVARWYDSTFYVLQSVCKFKIKTLADPIKWASYCSKNTIAMEHMYKTPILLHCMYESEQMLTEPAEPTSSDAYKKGRGHALYPLSRQEAAGGDGGAEPPAIVRSTHKRGRKPKEEINPLDQ